MISWQAVLYFHIRTFVKGCGSQMTRRRQITSIISSCPEDGGHSYRTCGCIGEQTWTLTIPCSWLLWKVSLTDGSKGERTRYRCLILDREIKSHFRIELSNRFPAPGRRKTTQTRRGNRCVMRMCKPQRCSAWRGEWRKNGLVKTPGSEQSRGGWRKLA